MTPQGCELSVVIPCYNEASCLAPLLERTSRACSAAARDYEMILVNDGSRDDTLAQLYAAQAVYPTLRIINLSRNYGHQIALTAGLVHARGARVLIMDADLQDPPELLPAMMEALDQGADVAYGQRRTRAGETFFKRVSAKAFYRFLGLLSDTPAPEDTGDFRLLSRRVVDLVNAMPERSRYLRGMIGWIGLTQTPILYDRAPRRDGLTKYPLTKMIRLAVDAMTGFSIVPLRLASYIGALLGVSAFLLLAYVLRAWLLDETVQGWTSLMIVVLVIGSAQLICLGVFGEYLGRLYMESKQRPLFIVESISPPVGPKEQNPCNDPPSRPDFHEA